MYIYIYKYILPHSSYQRMSWLLILFTSVNNERVFDSMENIVSFFYCLSNSCCFETIDNQVIAPFQVLVYLKNPLSM